jgi:predicted RNA-binding Zn-ribbon protein involved in translation (DUF1610 family)
MGEFVKIQCTNCDFRRYFCIGIGLLDTIQWYQTHRTGENSISLLTHSNRASSKIYNLIDNESATIANDFGREIYRCKKCGEFYGRFYIHLNYQNGSHEVLYACPTCKNKMERVKRNKKQDNVDSEMNDHLYSNNQELNTLEYPCPKCGEMHLQEVHDLFTKWD